MENNEKDDGYSEEEDEETGAEYITLYGNESNNFVGEYISVTLFADYAESSHAFLRQSAAKQILEVLQQAVASVEAFSEQDEVKKVFACITKLAQDEESMVKCTLLESLQKVASFCAEYDSPLVSLKPLIVSDILVIILKDIADECKTRNTRVRREAFNTLRYLLEENLVTQLNVEDTVSTIYSALVSDQRNVRNLIAAGNFISRMPPVVGEEATEKLLLPKISELCSHPHMRVREACVHFLIDLACFVNSMITENIIVPLFVKLSQDDELHVMKACAETTVMLSCLCLMESRKTVLCLSFIDLLQYGYNVTTSAFKHLGPFITTFAQPAITGLACNRNGDYVLVYSEDFEFPLHSRRTLFQCHEQEQNTREFTYVFGTYQSMKRDGSNDEDSYNNNQCDIDDWYMSKVTGREERERSHQVTKDENSNRNLNSIKYDDQPDLVQSCLQKVNADVENKTNDSLDEKQDINTSSPESVVEVDDFNSFQYWRDPIPEFDDTDLPSVNANVTINNMPVVWHRKGQTVHKARDMTMDTLFKTLKESKRFPRDRAMLLDRDRDRWMPVCETDTVEYGTLPSKIQDSSTSQQNIVPQILIDLFIDMPETFSLLAMDCAYTFPAVLVTIGAANWHLLKDLYNKLVIDGNKRVRNMIANNIHEIAAILGPELATQDLIPMYNSLIDDLEDVRITALTHLSSFIKLLKPSGRSIFLPHLMEFMMTDYNWNWRFREQLSEQLMEMMDYISPNDCWKYVSPVALSLLTDRVSAVRLQALNLVTRLIRNLSADITLLRSILAELAEQFAHSTQWSRRQSFAFLCSCLLKEPVLPDDMFARDVLPHLLDLSWDMIPNVRIAVARTLACDVITYPYFSNIFSPHYDVLTQVLKRLCSDKDRDVRYFASLKSQPLPSLPHFEVSYQHERAA